MHPPNTGLLIMYEREEVPETRFSGDLQKKRGYCFKEKEKGLNLISIYT